MALSEIDRNLVERCLDRQPNSWEDFVNRFMGLVTYVVNHSAQCRSMPLTPEDREDLCAEVFLAVIKDDFAILRRFRGQSSLATYLTVVARRVAVKALLGRKPVSQVNGAVSENGSKMQGPHADFEQRLTDREEVQRLLNELDEEEAQLVRQYHLEGKSYQQISQLLGIPENSVGPALSRAREKMRRATADRTAT